MYRPSLLIVAYLILLPASCAGLHNEELPLVTVALFMAGHLFESNDDLPLFPAHAASIRYAGNVVKHPMIPAVRCVSAVYASGLRKTGMNRLAVISFFANPV